MRPSATQVQGVNILEKLQALRPPGAPPSPPAPPGSPPASWDLFLDTFSGYETLTKVMMERPWVRTHDINFIETSKDGRFAIVAGKTRDSRPNFGKIDISDCHAGSGECGKPIWYGYMYGFRAMALHPSGDYALVVGNGQAQDIYFVPMYQPEMPTDGAYECDCGNSCSYYDAEIGQHRDCPYDGEDYNFNTNNQVGTFAVCGKKPCFPFCRQQLGEDYYYECMRGQNWWSLLTTGYQSQIPNNCKNNICNGNGGGEERCEAAAFHPDGEYALFACPQYGRILKVNVTGEPAC